MPFLSLSTSLKCQFVTDTHSLAFKNYFQLLFSWEVCAIISGVLVLSLYGFSNQFLDTWIIGILKGAKVGNHFLQASAVRLKIVV